MLKTQGGWRALLAASMLLLASLAHAGSEVEERQQLLDAVQQIDQTSSSFKPRVETDDERLLARDQFAQMRDYIKTAEPQLNALAFEQDSVKALRSRVLENYALQHAVLVQLDTAIEQDDQVRGRELIQEFMTVLEQRLQILIEAM